MAGENQRRFAFIPELIKQCFCSRPELDAAVFFGMIGVVVPDMVEMSKFGADATKIVPDTRQNGLDLFRRLFRKGGLEIGTTNSIFTESPADKARHAAEQIGGLDRVEIAGGAQQAK